MFPESLILLILIPLPLLFIPVQAKVPAIIVFGDSSVDAGNNDYIPTIGRSNFAPYGRDFEGGKATGRFCNGRLSTDYISDAFGIKPSIPAYLDPAYSIKDFATGVTFASAGTGLDNVTAQLASVIPMWKELEYFKDYERKLIEYMGKVDTATLLHESVYIISIGTNDFLENYFSVPVRSSHFTVDEYQNFLIKLTEDFVLDIYKLGARKIVLTGLTPFGCLPFERTANIMHAHACNEEYNEVGRDYNVKLKMLMAKLTTELRGIRLSYSNVYDPFVDAIQRPYLYGFEKVDAGCCGTGRVETGVLCNRFTPTCKDANKFVFWDSIHGTDRMYRIISDNLMRTNLAQFL